MGICGGMSPIEIAETANKVLRTIGNFPKRTSVYDYIIKSCRQQAEVIHNHEN
jgi:hypothetical protein